MIREVTAAILETHMHTGSDLSNTANNYFSI